MASSIHLIKAAAAQLVVACLTASTAFAADFPDHAVRIVVPAAAGGISDVIARIVGEKLTQQWGQAVIVYDRAGGGGIIGTQVVASAPPDGYTVLLVTTGFVTNPFMHKDMPYRTPEAFTPITILGSSPNVLVVNPAVAAQTLQELIELAKRKPGQLNYASSGLGSGGYFCMELLKQRAGIDITHVPYNAAAPATAAVVTGQTQMLITAIGSALPQIKGKALRAIAVTSPARLDTLPDVPTVAESGLPGYQADGWYAVIGPAGMPGTVVNTLYRDLLGVIKQPDVAAQFRTLGFENVGMPPDETARFIRSELKTWEAVVKKSTPQNTPQVR